MFTLRFESDTRRPQGDDLSFVVEATSFRTRQVQDGSVQVTISDGDEPYIIDGQLGGYDRCFVMNSAGATVAQYRPRPQRGAMLGECGSIGTGGDGPELPVR